MADNKLKRVLVLDDEPNIVNAVQRELKSPPFGQYRYEVEGFSDPLRALEHAKEQTFHAVITDYRMPEMDGLEFLKALAAIQPDCARLVLSGQTDMEALVRMINATHISRFIPKPWNDLFLKVALTQALHYSDTVLESRRLAALVRGSEYLTLAVPEREMDHILMVDDDPGVLSSLTRALSEHSRVDEVFSRIRSEPGQSSHALLREDQVTLHIAAAPSDALSMAESTTFSCVIADYKMPEMNGIDLLTRFVALQPNCARILISGGIGKGELIAAIDSAVIFAFIDKPWTDFELKMQIALALSQRRMLLENQRLAAFVGKRDAAAPD